MDTFLIFLEFLLNNIIKVSVLLAGIVVAIYFIQKSYRELRINKKLRRFQRRLRQNPIYKGKLRLAAFTGMVLLPVFGVVLFLIFTSASQIQYDEHVTSVSSSEDIVAIYETYHDKFSPSVSLRTSETADYSPNYYTEDALNLTPIESLNVVEHDASYLYVLYPDRITIIDTTSNPNAVHKNILVESDGLMPLQPIGIFADDNYVVAISQGIYMSESDEIELSPSYQTHMFVYDKHNDFELVDHYQINGEIIQFHKVNQRIVFVVNHVVPMSKGPDEIDTFLPTVSVNEVTTTVDYDAIHYIEGTKPEGFTSLFLIDLESKDVDFEGLLGSHEQHIHLTDDAIYVASMSYEFLEVTDVFVMSEPVRNIKTAFTRFSYEDTLNYEKTILLDGELINQFSMDDHNGYLRLVTTQIVESEIQNTLYILSESLDEVSTLKEIGEPGKPLNQHYFFDDYLYIFADGNTVLLHCIDMTNPESPLIDETLKNLEFPAYLFPLDDYYLIGLGYYDRLDDGIIDGVELFVFDRGDLPNLEKLFSEQVRYVDYGYSLVDIKEKHTTFIISFDHNLLILPIGVDSVSSSVNAEEGIAIYQISQDSGFEYRGFISHDEPLQYSPYHALIIGEYLYTVSSSSVSIVLLDDFTETVTVLSTLKE